MNVSDLEDARDLLLDLGGEHLVLGPRTIQISGSSAPLEAWTDKINLWGAPERKVVFRWWHFLGRRMVLAFDKPGGGRFAKSPWLLISGDAHAVS